jgi:hypothetical protein
LGKKCFLLTVSSQTSNFQATEQEYEKEKLNQRIAKLSGGVAVIQVKTNVKPSVPLGLGVFSMLIRIKQLEHDMPCFVGRSTDRN